MPQNHFVDSEAEMRERIRQNRLRSRLYTAAALLFMVFFLVFAICGVSLLVQTIREYREEKAFEDLIGMVGTDAADVPENQQTSPSGPDTTSPTSGPAPTVGSSVPADPAEPVILDKYLALYELNNDLFGWISIDGTDLNYPVMKTPDDEEFYLRRGYDKKYSRSGVPFLDKDCTVEGKNFIVYGHNMFNGTMFSLLESYSEEAFWKEHPTISFDTLYEEGEYQVVSAFYSRVFYQYETNVFRYYDYDDLSDPQDYADYVAWMTKQALYDTGVKIEEDDQLLTLITCSYGSEHERFIVLARKVS